MKKVVYLLLTLFTTIDFVSCGSDDDNNSDKYFQAIEGSWIIENTIPGAKYDHTYKFYKNENDMLVEEKGLWTDGTVITYSKSCIITKNSIILYPYTKEPIIYPSGNLVSTFSYKLENNVLTLTVKNEESSSGQISTRFVRQ